jgi:hypothetical protein
MSGTSPRRRLAAFGAAVVVALGLSALATTPAGAAGTVGFVRLAHLSPDTPDVDVYLDSLPGTPKVSQVFKGVGYGDVSKYLSLPTGTYTVAMRVSGAAATTPPVLSTQVTVGSGGAYTVAGVGKHADLGLRVLNDDLTLPAAGKAKVRIVQASVRAPVMTVSIAGGPVVADSIAFATTTDYLDVPPGHWTLKAQGAGGSPSSTLTATLAAGNVYSLIVLDAKAGNGLTAQLRVDAQRTGQVPTGGVATGAGGTSGRRLALPLAAATVLFLAGSAWLAVRARRHPVRVPSQR